MAIFLHFNLTIYKMNSLSQEKFAEKIGVICQTISKWETGNVVPDVGMLTRIADFYILRWIN
ncbi:hypothetical protein CUN29_11670 [Enterococcus faecalis]|nr:hypothetical protein CUN29_11670 [Enterococcus faecalis]